MIKMSAETTAEAVEPTDCIVYEPLIDDGDKQYSGLLDDGD